MTNSEITKAFLSVVDLETLELIVDNIAKQYGITTDQVFDEIFDEEAESLMDYITGEIRPTVSLFFNEFKKRSLQFRNQYDDAN